MNIIVPLAGPDYISASGEIKGLRLIRSQPLLTYILETRPWAKLNPKYHFIVHKTSYTDSFVDNFILKNYPTAKIVYVSDYAKGAAMSALAGLSLVEDLEAPLIIDLADIYFETMVDIMDNLNEENCGGIALYFDSDNENYSYLATDNESNVIEAAEKKVISRKASAGVYIYKNSQIYINALSNIMQTPEKYLHANLFFVCPVYNGVDKIRYKIKSIPVRNVFDVKTNGQ